MVGRVNFTRLVNVGGSGDGIDHDGGYSIKDWQVRVNVVVGHAVRPGVGIGVGKVLVVGRLNTRKVFGQCMENRWKLRRRFGTMVGPGVVGETLSNTGGLVDGINDELRLDTVTRSSRP